MKKKFIAIPLLGLMLMTGLASCGDINIITEVSDLGSHGLNHRARPYPSKSET